MNSKTNLGGNFTFRIHRPNTVKAPWTWKIKQFFAHRWREIPLWFVLLIARFIPGLTIMHGCTRMKKRCSDGTVIDYGVVGRHLITSAGKAYVASTFDNTAEPEVFKYHGFGTGTTAANVADTALVTECTTAYASDNTRPTGSQAHASATYTTVATFTPDAAVSCTEWGLFSQAANSGGTLLDRQVFSVVSLSGAGDSLQTTYVLTIS